jgi:hypothetical protein
VSRCEIPGRVVTVDNTKVVEIVEPEAVLQICAVESYMELDPMQEEHLQKEPPV